MLRVRVSGRSIGNVIVGSGEVIAVGRGIPAETATRRAESTPDLSTTMVLLASAAPHVSRSLCRIDVGAEVVRLRFTGKGEAQLSSLFDAPAGARRVTLVEGMNALLDEGENQLVILRGEEGLDGKYGDLVLSIDVQEIAEEDAAAETPLTTPDGEVTTVAPKLERFSREWFVALALSEPWLVGRDDYPRPPSNREIFERVQGWNRYAWNLSRPQRVDDSIRIISRLAFGMHEDPFANTEGRSQNVRFAVGRRTAEVRLVTAEDLADVTKTADRRAT